MMMIKSLLVSSSHTSSIVMLLEQSVTVSFFAIQAYRMAPKCTPPNHH